MAKLHLKLILIVIISAVLLFLAWNAFGSENKSFFYMNIAVIIGLIVLAIMNRKTL